MKISNCQMLSPPLKMKVLSLIVKTPEKKKFNFVCSALFHTKTRIFLKYYVDDCFRSFLLLTRPGPLQI